MDKWSKLSGSHNYQDSATHNLLFDLKMLQDFKISADGKTKRIGFKSLDHVRGQGVRRFKRGAYTLVREHFEAPRNAVPGH